jgi:hypothetical protein
MTPIFESQALQDTLNSVKENCIKSMKMLIDPDYVKLDKPIKCEILMSGESTIITHIALDEERFICAGEIANFELAFDETNVDVLISVLKEVELKKYKEEDPYYC